MLFLKVLFFVVVVLLVVYIIRLLRKQFIPDKNQCPKCKGKGYYMATRGREWCEMCHGTGKINRDK